MTAKRTISRTLSVSKPEISPETKSLISGLIKPNGKNRLSILKIKQHDFFKPISWADVEN